VPNNRILISAFELAGLAGAVYFAYRWKIEPAANFAPLFFLSMAVVAVSDWFRRDLPDIIEPAQLAKFIETGRALIARRDESPLPTEALNEWIAEMNDYFARRRRFDYVARLNNFDDMPLYLGVGQGVRANFLTNVEGRFHRLHQFMSEKSGGRILVLIQRSIGSAKSKASAAITK
jgi:hypothetical protein